jgi:hypothetical protein
MVQGVLDNAEDFSAEEIATKIFEGISAGVVRRILAFARALFLQHEIVIN